MSQEPELNYYFTGTNFEGKLFSRIVGGSKESFIKNLVKELNKKYREEIKEFKENHERAYKFMTGEYNVDLGETKRNILNVKYAENESVPESDENRNKRNANFVDSTDIKIAMKKLKKEIREEEMNFRNTILEELAKIA